MSIDYHELAALRDLYLEDSWILDIRIDPHAVEFTIDFVLTEAHPEYSPPKPNEQYCYRSGTLRFADVRTVCWMKRGARPAIDASGKIDFGNIDAFTFEDDRYSLVGEWGNMAIEASSPPVVTLE